MLLLGKVGGRDVLTPGLGAPSFESSLHRRTAVLRSKEHGMCCENDHLMLAEVHRSSLAGGQGQGSLHGTKLPRPVAATAAISYEHF